MAVRIRKTWVAGAAVLAVAALLGWAWWQGGAEPLRALSAPTTLPQVAQ